MQQHQQAGIKQIFRPEYLRNAFPDTSSDHCCWPVEALPPGVTAQNNCQYGGNQQTSSGRHHHVARTQIKNQRSGCPGPGHRAQAASGHDEAEQALCLTRLENVRHEAPEDRNHE